MQGSKMGCLIFDSDGTLVDSELINNKALSLELRDQGITETPEALVSRYRGWKLAAALEDLQVRHGRNLTAGFTRRFRLRAEQSFRKHLTVVPGIFGALETLKALGYPMCVASNAPMEKLNAALEITGLDGFFENNVFSAYEVGCWKPEPGLFQHAADVMGFAVSECIVVEDSQVGVTAASAAGIRAVLFDPALLVEEPGEAVVISSMDTLPAAVQSIFNTN